MRENRRELRFEPELPVSIHFLGAVKDNYDDIPEAIGYINNISRHGLLISTAATNAPIASRQPVRLRVKVGKGKSYDMLGEVRWSQRHGFHNELGLLLFESRGTDYLLWQNYISSSDPQKNIA